MIRSVFGSIKGLPVKTEALQEAAHIEFQDLATFKSASAASLSLVASRLLGIASSTHALPSFPILVDCKAKTAYISGVALCEHRIDCVIMTFDDTSDEGHELHHYAAAWLDADNGEWQVGNIIATDNLVTDNFNLHPHFSDQTMSEQLKQLGV